LQRRSVFPHSRRPAARSSSRQGDARALGGRMTEGCNGQHPCGDRRRAAAALSHPIGAIAITSAIVKTPMTTTPIRARKRQATFAPTLCVAIYPACPCADLRQRRCFDRDSFVSRRPVYYRLPTGFKADGLSKERRRLRHLFAGAPATERNPSGRGMQPRERMRILRSKELRRSEVFTGNCLLATRFALRSPFARSAHARRICDWHAGCSPFDSTG
jgi:hypothetical protein